MTLFYRHTGNGRDIIILHGLYGSSDNWHKISQKLSSEFSVYTLDLRNHGNSPHSDDFTIGVMADDLREFFDDLKLSKAIIIGHSLGGKVAMEFASKHPEFVEKLIIVDIAPRTYSENEFTERRNHRFIINYLKSIDLQKFKNRSEALEEMSKIDPTGRLKFFMMKNIKRQKDGKLAWKINIKAIADNLSDLLNKYELKLSEITCPVLFVKGEKSEYLTENDFKMIKNELPNAEFTIIKDATHWLHSEKPDEFVEIVRNFIEKR